MKPVADSYEDQIALIDPNKPVRCYRNLHTGLWSVKQDRVAFHTNQIFLKDVEFLVNEKHRQRVILEKRKNVHAFVKGYICKPSDWSNQTFYREARIYYNPYQTSHFMCGEVPIHRSVQCCLVKRDGKMLVKAKGVGLETQPSRESVPTHLL